ncbi:MAG: orotate phosphoribosyltransferase [Pseudomonadota bacterium]
MTSAEKLARLKEIVRDRSFSEGEAKTLASGRTSNFYFNMKMTMSQPEGLVLIADLMLDKLAEGPCDVVGGLAMGAVPIVNAISMRSFQTGSPIPLIWIRKEAKEHGTQATIEGEDMANLAGKTAVMVEDVTTTGGSVMKAIEAVRANGVTVDRVITIVDRLEGAEDALSKEGLSLTCLLNADDFRS